MSPEPDEYAAGVADYGNMPGWLLVSSVLLLTTGVVHIAIGTASLSGRTSLSATGPPWGSLPVWGFAWLALGVGQLLSALLIQKGRPLGRAAGIALAVALMVIWFVNFTFLPPVAFALALTCGLVLYGLLVC